MTRASRFATSVAMACPPLLANAEGKCGDDPKKLKTGDLVVTWTLPVPAGAEVVPGVEDAFFAALDSAIGEERPSDLPQKVRSDLVTGSRHPVADDPATSADPRKSRKAKLADLIAWEQAYDIRCASTR